ncbi:MAG: hypothetical protein ACEQR8_05290, partial [Cypionkella sp.]
MPADLANAEERSRLARAVGAFDRRWPGGRRKAGSLALALLLEAGLIALLFTLGRQAAGTREASEALTTVSFAPEPPPAEPTPPAERTSQPTALPRAPTPPRPALPTPPQPMPPPAAIIPVAPPTSAAPSAPPAPPQIRAVIRAQDSGPAGPPNRPSPGDMLTHK